jgi:hypothetical protein
MTNIARDGGKPKNTSPPEAHPGMSHKVSHNGVTATAVGMSRTASQELLSGVPAVRSGDPGNAPKRLDDVQVNPGMVRNARHPHGAAVARPHPNDHTANKELGARILDESIQAADGRK